MSDKSIAPDYELSQIPRYLQVAAAIRRRIEDGYWKANDKIATLVELEEEFQVARTTVRQAVEVLQNQGLVKRIQGKGTFVDGSVVDKRWLLLDMRWSRLVETIGQNVPRLITLDDPGTMPVVDDHEGKLAKKYVYIESVQSRGRQRFAYARVHVAKSVFDLAPERFSSEPAITVIASLPKLAIASAKQFFIVGDASAEIARHLAVHMGFPTAEARIVVKRPDDEIIYVGNVVYRGDCVRIDVDLLD